eukprot:7330083-Pyramimonas_sp.AAC.1
MVPLLRGSWPPDCSRALRACSRTHERYEGKVGLTGGPDLLSARSRCSSQTLAAGGGGFDLWLVGVEEPRVHSQSPDLVASVTSWEHV